MKSRQFSMLCGLALILSLGGSLSLAQEKKRVEGKARARQQPSRTTEEQTRDLIKQFESGKTDGLQVVVYLKGDNGSLHPVEPTHAFRQGDEVKFSIRSNSAGYVYIVNKGASGTYRVVIPDKDEDNLLLVRRDNVFPSKAPLQFDHHQGTETLQIFVGKQRLTFFDRIVQKSPDGALSEAEVATLNKLWESSDGGINGILKMKVTTTTNQGAIRGIETRDPIFDLGKKATLILPRRPKATQAKNEAMAFSMKLQNVGAK